MIKEGIINFEYFNFVIFFVDLKLLYARKLDSELVVLMVYLTVYHFLARVQSPTCTTYGKFLLKTIMVVLTLKSSIKEIYWLISKGMCALSFDVFKGNAQFVQKVTLQPLMEFKQSQYGS